MSSKDLVSSYFPSIWIFDHFCADQLEHAAIIDFDLWNI